MTEQDHRQGIFIAHRSALIAYATPILGSREAAVDIVQDAFLKFASAATAGSPEQMLGYLYRIVRNLAFDVLKRRKVETREQQDGLPFWALPRKEATPEQNALFCEEVQCVTRVMAELPAEMRIAVEMHRFGGHTLEEVASHLGISVSTAHRHVRTVMLRLAGELDRLKS